MTTEIIEAEATTLPATLSDELQGIARRYVDARRRANESTLEAAAALAEAREKAKHGEWYAFLRATNTSEDLADRLLAIHEQAQRHPAFAETVAKGWLPMTQAALLARPSTPPEVREQVLEQAAERAAQQQPPPAKREVERAIQEARPAPPPPAPHPAPVRDVTPPPAPTPRAPWLSRGGALLCQWLPRQQRKCHAVTRPAELGCATLAELSPRNGRDRLAHHIDHCQSCR